MAAPASRFSPVEAAWGEDDTIVAVSTARGAAQRGIVRMSGPEALSVLETISVGRASPLPKENYRFVERGVHAGEAALPARIYIMRAPSSYTREDIVEIHVVACPAVLESLTAALVRAGCRPAGPGEFTRRAFLNGRMDLAQAEAVEALIHARGLSEYRAAAAALSGHLSRKIESLRQDILALTADVEASLDFGDQDIEMISREQVASRLVPIRAELRRLVETRLAGKVPGASLRVILFGPPNAGKSSLLNAVLRRRRAMVSPHPGTTRDTVEATLLLGETEICLVDTAGLRPPSDEIESLAVSRSRAGLREADIAVCVLDAARTPSPDTLAALANLDPQRGMILLNKRDLGPCREELRAAFPDNVETLNVSALTGAGIPEFLAVVVRRLGEGRVDRTPDDAAVNTRQESLLRRATAALDRALGNGNGPEFMDLAANDLREALDLIAQVLGAASPAGRLVSDDILDTIFAGFCIGK